MLGSNKKYLKNLCVYDIQSWAGKPVFVVDDNLLLSFYTGQDLEIKYTDMTIKNHGVIYLIAKDKKTGEVKEVGIPICPVTMRMTPSYNAAISSIIRLTAFNNLPFAKHADYWIMSRTLFQYMKENPRMGVDEIIEAGTKLGSCSIFQLTLRFSSFTKFLSKFYDGLGRFPLEKEVLKECPFCKDYMGFKEKAEILKNQRS